jgi:uncharacterized protein (DUF1501 family)
MRGVRAAVSRRAFAKGCACALVGLGSIPRFLVRAAGATGTSAAEGRRKVLVAVFQRGAVDGLAMVAPHGDPAYAAARPGIGLAPPRRGDSEVARDLDGLFSLHPALAPLVPLWENKALAIVHACGSPDATRSHFDAQDYMESGTPGVKRTEDGWLARTVRSLPPDPSPLRAVALVPFLPRSLAGEPTAIATSSLAELDLRPGPVASATRQGFEALYAQSVQQLLRGTSRETFEAVELLRRAQAARLPVANGAEYPRGRFGDSLRQIAQLIRADVGLEVAFTDIGGWDTHVAQGGERGQLANRLRELGEGVAAFARDLGDRLGDVVILTMSEFGRTVAENGNRGTDHGHGTAMLVLGGGVRGGRVYGRWPGLAAAKLYEGRDLAVTTDFRTLFAEVAYRHLGAPAEAPLFPGWSGDGKPLGLFG